MRRRPLAVVVRACAATLVISSPCSAPIDAQPAPRVVVTHTWKPVREGAEVQAIDVVTTLQRLPVGMADSLVLDAPITYAGVPGIAERVQGLAVQDAQGPVTLRVVDETPHPGGFPHYRRWHATRTITPPLRITYKSLAPHRAVGGPPFSLLATDGGVSGAGSGFLVLPVTSQQVVNHVEWDLSGFDRGARGVTSWGVGTVEVTGPPAELRQGWIMAGPVGRYPASGAEGRFSATWLGTPAWDPAATMTWARRMYESLGEQYGYLSPLPTYRVFVRVGSRGGTALGSSFMLGTTRRGDSAAVDPEGPRLTIAHEMGHLFVGSIEAPLGVASWFTEGLNTYYTRLLPMRGGFITVDEYVRQVNADFQAYFRSPSRNLSADSIVKVGFRDEDTRHIPYLRGSFYFADLDVKIREASGGRRTLDRVLRELFEARARGQRLDHDLWIRTVVREAGPSARDDFEAIVLRGERTVVPPAGAFGPCVTRREVAAAGGMSYEWVRMPGRTDAQCRAPW